MFYHNFKCSLKILLKNKGLVFWTFVFPIILGIFFNMAFSDIDKKEKFNSIDIAVVSSEDFNNNVIFKQSIEFLSDEKSDNKMFNTVYTSKKKATYLLENNKIDGYLTFLGDNVNITIKKNGVNQTILKYIIEDINSNKKILAEASNIPEALSLIKNNSVKLNNITNKNLGFSMIEYYTLIAMACLYGSMLSMYVLNYSQANISSVGKRISVSSSKKTSLLLSGFFASYVVQLIGIFLLLFVTLFLFKVDYGNNLIYVFILSLFGSLAGLALGIAISSIGNISEVTKNGILISIIMFFCFLSGMMGVSMKYIIDKNIPFLNKINPANMITDGFYSLYYYDNLNRFYFNLLSLFIFSIIMILISLRNLRRQEYDSI